MDTVDVSGASSFDAQVAISVCKSCYFFLSLHVCIYVHKHREHMLEQMADV